MFGRTRDNLRDLIRNQHDEFMQYQARRDEESQRRDEEFRRLVEETREYNREILLRNEKVYTTVIARLEELGEETRSNIEETRAQTKALLRLIDRFDESGGAAAA
jgi:undecaprenyl pyrophosphate synthase